MWTHIARLAALTSLVFGLAGLSTSAMADEWPQFRGINADGVAQSQCMETWDTEKNVLWKIPMEGEGWSCPVVWGDQVFLTAAIRTDEPADEASTPEQSEGKQQRGRGRGRGYDVTNSEYRWEVMCLSASTGEIQWRVTAREGSPPISRHRSNTFATETPVTDGERIYAYFGMTGLFCYNIAGELQWEKDLGTYEMRAGWGTSSSPILFKGKLFLQIDNEEQSFIVALDAVSGEEVWRVNRDEISQYSTPIIWKNSGRVELVTGGRICRSYDPSTGELLWELNMARGRSSATPLAVGDTLYVGTEARNRGGDDDGGGYLFAVKAGGSGDITPQAEATSSEFVAWKIAKAGLDASSPAICDGRLYLLARRGGIVHCVDAETGETVYRKRIPDAGAFWASPWVCLNRIYCLDDAGTTHVLAAGPELNVLAENVLGEQAWSSPAIANNALYLRTTEHLYCIASQE